MFGSDNNNIRSSDITVKGARIDTTFSLGTGLVGLIADIKQQQAKGDLRGIVNRLDTFVRSPGKVERSLPQLSSDETLLYNDEHITVYHISTPPGIFYPAHEHDMISITCIYGGQETHVFYEPANDALKHLGEVTFTAPVVVDMHADAVHAICNRGKEPTRTLHFYLGDLENQKRRMWDADGENPRQYVHKDYLDLARPLAEVKLPD